MDSIGNTLRNERLRRGLKLEQVTEWTRIGQPILQAIEANRFERLPGGFFTRSFIRQYAHVLDLDEEQLVASFKDQCEEPALPLPTLATRPLPHPLMPTLGLLMILLLLGGGVYTLWETMQISLPNSRTKPTHVAQARSDSAALAKKWVQLPITMPTPLDNQAFPVSAQIGQNLSPGNVGTLRVVFSAREPVWISIESEGNHVYSGTLQAEEHKDLQASGKIIVLIGNAGGLEVSLNGKPVGSLGQRGQVCLLEVTTSGAHVVKRSALVTD